MKRATAWIAALAWAFLWLAEPASGQILRRVTVAEDGTEPDDFASPATLGRGCSATGRFVVFESPASNLVPGDTNSGSDAFVKDLRTGAVERVSVDSSGAEGFAGSGGGVISADGNLVAFATPVSFDPSDTGGWDVYLRDRAAGTTTRISLTSTGAEPDDRCIEPSISADGRFVTFTSEATNLVPGDTNGFADVFLVDRSSGTIERISVEGAGTEANDESGHGTVSADGMLVAFDSKASNLGGRYRDLVWDVFVRDRAAGVTRLVSRQTGGAPAGGRRPTISDDGSSIGFVSTSRYIAGDKLSFQDVFVTDLASGTTSRVSVDSSGAEADAGARDWVTLSGDGTRVAFASDSTNLVAGDANGVTDVFVHDRTTGTTQLVSFSTAGGQGDAQSDLPSLSQDGAWTVFVSIATNLDPTDTNGLPDIYAASIDGTAADRVTYGTGLAGGLGVPAIDASRLPVIGLDLDLLVDCSTSAPTMGVLFLGFARDSTAILGGVLLVDWAMLLPLALAPPETVVTLAIPDDAVFDGLVVDLQAFELDPAAVEGVSMTPGLELTLGY